MVITTAATNASEYLPCARRENVFVFKKGNYTLWKRALQQPTDRSGGFYFSPFLLREPHASGCFVNGWLTERESYTGDTSLRAIFSNLSSLLYGTRTKLFHIGFVSFRGLKYTTHDRFRGNFPYEWGSSKSRMLKEGSRLPRHSKIPLKSLMRWSRKPFLSSSILQNYKTSVFWRETILSVMVSWFQLFLATKRDRGLYKPVHVSTINYCLHSSQSCVEIIQIWTIAFFQFLLLTFKAMNLVNNSW